MKDNLIFSVLILPLLSSVCAFVIKKPQILRNIILISISGVVPYLIYLLFALSKEQEFLMNFSSSLSLRFIVEPIGMIFLGIVGLLWFFSLLYSIGYFSVNRDEKQTIFFGFFSLSIFCTIGVALSANLFTLFIFYELLTFVTYPLVVHNRSEKAQQVGKNYILYLLGTSTLLLLPALVILHDYNPDLIFNKDQFFLSFSSKSIMYVIIVFLIYGFAKTAIFPVHGWLPQAMIAPTPVSAMLHAVTVVKAGVFCLIKVFTYVFGLEIIADTLGKIILNDNFLTCLAAVSVIFASLKATKQKNLKHLLAYSTIAQLSTCLLALSILTPSGVVASILHVVGHAFAKITLFFAVGIIYLLYGKTNIDECKLLYKHDRLLCILFSIAGLSLIGVPPFFGFWSKYYIITHAWQNNNWLVIITVLISTMLTATYIIPIFYNFYWADEKSNFERKKISVRNLTYLYIPMIFTSIICILGMVFIPMIINFVEKGLH